MQKVYFDESGQTGTNLFDPDQPFFALASTDLSEREAADIIARSFPGQQGPELKSANVFRRPTGRRNFLNFAKEVGTRPNSFCAAKISKRYVVVSKIVDQLVEPMLRDAGYDFYKDGYAIRFANSVGYMFEHLLQRADADRILSSYNEFARTPTAPLLRAFRSELGSVLANPPNGTGTFLSLIAQGAAEAAANRDLTAFEDSNEIHVTSAIECMKFWQEKTGGPFEVIHDESTHFFKRSDMWERMTNPDLEPQIFTIGDKTLRFPIPVVSTVSAKSHENASLQVCDLIAGFTSRVSAPGASEEMVRFRREAIEQGLGEVLIYPVEFGIDFAPGGPPRADGPDIVDQIASAINRPRPRK